jgi:hypothetical protein
MEPEISSANGVEESAAHKLKEAHADHHATVEDAVDEDLKPRTSSSDETGNGAEDSAAWGTTMSSKAAGKQKENSAPGGKLDTRSEELFPSLGGGNIPKPAASGKNLQGHWAVGKPNGKANGATPTNGTSRASTPASEGPALAPAPAPTQGSQRGPPSMSIPGRNVETVTLDPQYILPRGQLKRPIPDILKDLNRKSRAKVTMSSSANGRLKFDASGPSDVAQQALKDLVQQIGAKVWRSLILRQSLR